jgi:two-component system, sensor histidine kinase and response regulator
MPGQDGAALGRRIAANPALGATRLILLTSSGLRGDGQRFAELGFAGYLLKPVTQRDLNDCLLLVMESGNKNWQMRTQPMVTRHHLRVQRERSKHRLLLAEDNLVNQKVARLALERLGHRVNIVGNGREAVEHWQAGGYDLILMDCQMPELDGYAATREIRALEAGQSRIPIIALTAHAMKGAGEECLAAGMDAHLSKPLDREQLERCLSKFLVQSADAGTAPAESSGTQDAETPVDVAALRALLDGDSLLEQELIADYASTGSSLLKAILDAISSNDFAAIQQAAHTLKGASASLYANASASLAGRIENAAKAGERAQISVLADELSQQVMRTIDFLESMPTAAHK